MVIPTREMEEVRSFSLTICIMGKMKRIRPQFSNGPNQVQRPAWEDVVEKLFYPS